MGVEYSAIFVHENVVPNSGSGHSKLTVINLYTWLLGVRVCVHPLPEVWGHGMASLLTSHVIMEGALWSRVISQGQAEQQVHDRSQQSCPGARQRQSRLGSYRTPLE